MLEVWCQYTNTIRWGPPSRWQASHCVRTWWEGWASYGHRSHEVREASWPTHLPRAPPMNASHWALGFQHMNLEGTQMLSRCQGFSLSTCKDVCYKVCFCQGPFRCLMILNTGIATVSRSATNQSPCSKVTFCFLTHSHQLGSCFTISLSPVSSSWPSWSGERAKNLGEQHAAALVSWLVWLIEKYHHSPPGCLDLVCESYILYVVDIYF